MTLNFKMFKRFFFFVFFVFFVFFFLFVCCFFFSIHASWPLCARLRVCARVCDCMRACVQACVNESVRIFGNNNLICNNRYII